MGDLKPLGSEKLTGKEKINRIIEISRYNENRPTNINETSKSEYGINLADGNEYQIVREKLGYVIKKTISESETDYIEPMKNRKYYSSYGQALKRLNLITKEVNRLTENVEGTSLFGEQKKFVLKTPTPSVEDSAPVPAPPAEPPAVPSPELPPSPIGGDEPMPAGDEPMPTEDEPTPTDGEDTPMGGDGGKDGEEVTFKTIQKLTGKLGQKLRELNNEKGMTSENIKYVINMVLSALELQNLSEEDKEDIMSKFDGEESDMDDMGMEDMGGEESGMEDMGSESGGMEDMGTSDEMGENSSHGSIFDSIFGESKIDKVISKYFQISKNEKTQMNESLKRKNIELKKKIGSIKKLSETIEQQLVSEKFIKENSNFNFIGKTNKKNLVFENKGNQIKISPEGSIL
jgi:hypothetical protein